MRKRFRIKPDKDNRGEYTLLYKRKGFLGYFSRWKEMCNTNDWVDAVDLLKEAVRAEDIKDTDNIKSMVMMFFLNSIGAAITTYVCIMVLIYNYFTFQQTWIFSLGWTVAMGFHTLMLAHGYLDFLQPKIIVKRGK